MNLGQTTVENLRSIHAFTAVHSGLEEFRMHSDDEPMCLTLRTQVLEADTKDAFNLSVSIPIINEIGSAFRDEHGERQWLMQILLEGEMPDALALAQMSPNMMKSFSAEAVFKDSRTIKDELSIQPMAIAAGPGTKSFIANEAHADDRITIEGLSLAGCDPPLASQEQAVHQLAKLAMLAWDIPGSTDVA